MSDLSSPKYRVPSYVRQLCSPTFYRVWSRVRNTFGRLEGRDNLLRVTGGGYLGQEPVRLTSGYETQRTCTVYINGFTYFLKDKNDPS